MANLNRILPDTNVLIYAFAGQQPFSKLVDSWTTNRQLVFSPIVVSEFLVRAVPSDEKMFELYLKQFPVMPLDIEGARIAANFRKTSLKHKTRPHLADCLIAAQCFQHKLTLATMNPSDFPPEVSIYDLRSSI